MKIGEGTRFTVAVDGQYAGQTVSDPVIVEGKDAAHFDESGYLIGDANGVVKVKVTVTNAYGTYDSNIVSVTVGKGNLTTVKITQPKSSKNLILLIVGIVVSVLILGEAVIVFILHKKKKKKKEKENEKV